MQNYEDGILTLSTNSDILDPQTHDESFLNLNLTSTTPSNNDKTTAFAEERVGKCSIGVCIPIIVGIFNLFFVKGQLSITPPSAFASTLIFILYN